MPPMMSGAPAPEPKKEYSNEEIAKLEKSRTISDADFLKGGAEYKINDQGEKQLYILDGQETDPLKEMDKVLRMRNWDKEMEEQRKRTEIYQFMGSLCFDSIVEFLKTVDPTKIPDRGFRRLEDKSEERLRLEQFILDLNAELEVKVSKLPKEQRDIVESVRGENHLLVDEYVVEKIVLGSDRLDLKKIVFGSSYGKNKGLRS